MLANQSLDKADKRQSKAVIEDKRREKSVTQVANSIPSGGRPSSSPSVSNSTSMIMQESDGVKVGNYASLFWPSVTIL